MRYKTVIINKINNRKNKEDKIGDYLTNHKNNNLPVTRSLQNWWPDKSVKIFPGEDSKVTVAGRSTQRPKNISIYLYISTDFNQ